jgi:lipopolysaccharide export system permease protein
MPVAIAIDVSEKIRKFIKHDDLSTMEIIKDYYVNFIIFYANMFMPLTLFIAVIMFTSKLAGNTEIIAMNSGGLSFKRFLRPYIIGSFVVFLIAFFANHFVVPKSQKVKQQFEDKYLNRKKLEKTSIINGNLQLNNKGDYVFIKSFNLKNNKGRGFSYEHFDGIKLKYKIIGRNITWNKEDSTYTIHDYKKRWIGKNDDIIEKGKKMDTVFSFLPNELVHVDYLAREMNSLKLNKWIDKSIKRGVKNLNSYRVELYKRTSVPVSAFILTIIAVALAYKKRRGGIGINLAIGVVLMFIYVFFMKVTEVLGASATANPLFLVWLPNGIFGILALFLYRNAKK